MSDKGEETMKTKTIRLIEGLRYTESAPRDQRQDVADALASSRDSYEVLVFMHRLGYNCSTARVRSVRVRVEEN